MRKLTTGRVVVKIGSSLLTHSNAKLNINRIDILARTLTDLINSSKEVILVSSGAIAAGMGRMNILDKPDAIPQKQALAAVGQAVLMKIYQRLFNDYNQVAAQVLLTKGIMKKESLRNNAKNTLTSLFQMGVIPIINENDTVATEEIVFGDNDSLSAYIATLMDADLLVLLTDIDGLYTKNPRTHSDAKLVNSVSNITDEIRESAGGNGSNLGTGGMYTKIQAVEICAKSKIPTIIANGENPNVLFDILDGKDVGTVFNLNN